MPHLTDFPDRLPAMLVKELRQGMRARGFTMLFLVLQGLLAVILLAAGSGASSDNAGAVASGIIFTLFSIAMLGIQPMRGVTALSSEVTGNTIEMMVLTRLSASRIVLGKWLAIVSQSALILTTIIPYLILRYFFGGMVLVGELVLLVLIFITSMALTAVTVGLSGGSNKLVRILPFVMLVFLMQSLPMFMLRGGLNGIMEYFSLTDPDARIMVGSYLVFICYYAWCALSMGTSSIAPMAENHTSIRRLVALVLAILAAASSFHPAVQQEAILFAMVAILAPAVIVSLTEPSVMLPPLCKPFRKRGPLGKFAAYFLMPGWPAGVFFSLLLLGIAGLGLYLSAQHALRPWHLPELEKIVILACVGGILLPATLSAIFSKQESKRLANFIIFLVASVLLTVIPQILAGINDKADWLWAMIWNPPIGLVMLGDNRLRQQLPEILNALAVVDSIIICTLLVRATLGWRRYRETFAEVDAEMAMTPPAATEP